MRKRRKRQPMGPWIAAAAVLIAALWILLANVVFVVRNVRVVGAGDLSDAEVVHLSGIRLGGRMSAVDEARVHLDVESSGQLAFVSLEKRLPDTLVLTVRPRTLDALILQAGKILVLDSDAYVVRVTDRLPEGDVIYVTGIKAAYYTLGRQLDTGDGRCAAMKAVVEALKKQGATRYVAELSVANTEAMRVITRTGMTVTLGDAQSMDAKIAWMAGALSDLEARGETSGLLDVSSGTKADYRPPAVEPEDAEAAQEGEEAAETAPETAPAS